MRRLERIIYSSTGVGKGRLTVTSMQNSLFLLLAIKCCYFLHKQLHSSFFPPLYSNTFCSVLNCTPRCTSVTEIPKSVLPLFYIQDMFPWALYSLALVWDYPLPSRSLGNGVWAPSCGCESLSSAPRHRSEAEGTSW